MIRILTITLLMIIGLTGCTKEEISGGIMPTDTQVPNPDLTIPTPSLPTTEEVAALTSQATQQNVRITTNKGVIDLELYPDSAPMHVASFLKLIAGGFYNGLTFHRVIPGFVAQGGDPDGNGTGGPGYTIPAEFNERKHLTGTLAMARSADPNSAGSQFYITLAPQPGLDGQYTVFGQVIAGMDVVQALVVGDTMTKLELITK